MQMKVFNKGQIVLPSILRKKYSINVGDFLEVVSEDRGIKLIPIKKERLTNKLFGVFANYKNGKPELTEKDIEKATIVGFRLYSRGIKRWTN